MTLPLYASAEQIMRDKTELARKGIARGRSVVQSRSAKMADTFADKPAGPVKVGTSALTVSCWAANEGRTQTNRQTTASAQHRGGSGGNPRWNFQPFRGS